MNITSLIGKTIKNVYKKEVYFGDDEVESDVIVIEFTDDTAVTLYPGTERDENYVAWIAIVEGIEPVEGDVVDIDFERVVTLVTDEE